MSTEQKVFYCTSDCMIIDNNNKFQTKPLETKNKLEENSFDCFFNQHFLSEEDQKQFFDISFPTIPKVVNVITQTPLRELDLDKDIIYSKKKKENRIIKKFYLQKKEINRKNICEKDNASAFLGKKKERKYSNDCMLKKIKHYFLKIILDWINKRLPVKLKIKKQNGKIATNCSKNDNLNLLDKTFREIYSERISDKYNRIHKDYNKRLIDVIIKRNISNTTINKLNLTFREGYYIFLNGKISEDIQKKIFKEAIISNDKKDKYLEEFLNGMKTKKDFFLYIEKKGNNGNNIDYRKKLELFCLNLVNYLDSIKRK